MSRFIPAVCASSGDSGGLSRHPVVGYVGRLTLDKGIPELICAFEQILQSYPNAELLLVGWFDESEDALPNPLRECIQSHSSIVYTGLVDETAPYYHRMDLLVLPTYREGFPNVILEAAASGLPVVTTTATGASDAVVDGETGLIVEPGDSEALAAAVLRILEDSALRRRMGREARRWVSANFERSTVQSQTVSFYRGLAGKTGPARASLEGFSVPAVLD